MLSVPARLRRPFLQPCRSLLAEALRPLLSCSLADARVPSAADAPTAAKAMLLHLCARRLARRASTPRHKQTGDLSPGLRSAHSAAHLAKRRREESMGRLSAPARGNATLGRRLNPRATRRSRGAHSRSATTSFPRTARSGRIQLLSPTSSSSGYRRASTSTTMRSTRACVSCSDGSTRTASRPQLRSSGTSRTRRRRASTARRRY